MSDDPVNDAPQASEAPAPEPAASVPPPEDAEWDTPAPQATLLTNSADPPQNRDVVSLTDRKDG